MTLRNNLNALVVEDHDFQRWTFVRMLRSLGLKNILEAKNGLQALDILKEHGTVDLLLCDLAMEGMDGMELIRSIGQDNSVKSVVVVSGYGRPVLDAVATMTRAYGLNLLGAVEKPLTIGALKQLLSKNDGGGRSSNQIHDFSVAEILDGIRRKQFEAYFQPKINLATHRITGAEALARWRHPEHGVIGPDDFIHSLEQAGEIDELTFVILEQASLACRRWHRLSPELTVSVNISVTSLGDPTLADQILAVARSAEIEPQNMILEITETAAAENLAATLENLVRLRMRGVGLSIDDYGTGFASLQQLQLAPFSELKIDKCFVNGCASESSSRAIVESSVQIARQLGFQSVGEGVETQGDLNVLKEVGCDMAQGYFIARPMLETQFMDFLTKWPRRRRRTFQ